MSQRRPTAAGASYLRLEVEGLKKESLACHAKMEAVTVEKVAADKAEEGGLFAAFSFSLW